MENIPHERCMRAKIMAETNHARERGQDPMTSSACSAINITVEEQRIKKRLSKEILREISY